MERDDIAATRIEQADNGTLDGQTERLLRKARFFSSRAGLMEFVGRLSDENWQKWLRRLAADYAAE
jgi:hypothetical protein